MSEKPRNGGETLAAERTRLARMLEASGHGQCAYDLEAADDADVEEVAYEIAEHVEQACGDFRTNPDLADKIRKWADRLVDMP